jgi:hypothetical protein
VPEAYRPPATVGNSAGWLSLTLGTVAMILCLLQPGNTGTSKGFLVSTVGITAVAWGLQSLSLGRRGLSTVRLAPWVGIVFGVIGTMVMVVSMIGFYLSPSEPVTTTSALPPTSVAVPEAASPVEAVPAGPAAYASAEEERLSLTRQLGTVAFVLGQPTSGVLLPDSLVVDPATGLVLTSDGQTVARVDPDAAFTYELSADRTRYTMTLVGPRFGSSLGYDSAVGYVVELLAA